MKIYFMRHGRTEWNQERRFQGSQGDSPLLKQSKIDLIKAGEKLGKIPFAHIYASPLQRTKVTAETIANQFDYKVPISFDNALKEISLGKMEGKTASEVKKSFSKEYNNFLNHPQLYDNEKVNGESFNHLQQRLRGFLKKITKEYGNDQNILVVSHGEALNALLKNLIGLPLAQLKNTPGLDNTSVSVLDTKDQGKSYKLLDWNNTSYVH